MAVTWQSAQTATGSSSLGITKPTGTVAGDLLIAHVTVIGNINVDPPSGWTNLGVSDEQDAVYVKLAGSSEPSSYTFTSGGGPTTTHGVIHRITGASATTVSGTSIQGVNSTTSPVLSLAGLTPIYSNCLLMGFSSWANGGTFSSIAVANNNPSWSTAASLSEGSGSVSYVDQYGAYAPTTPTGTATATISGTPTIGTFSFTLLAIYPPLQTTIFGSTFSTLVPTTKITKVVAIFGSIFTVLAPSLITNTIWTRQLKSSTPSWTTQNKSIL